MSTYPVDLQKSVVTNDCKVNTFDAKRFKSQRINGNRCAMVCPRWNGKDAYGRAICKNSAFLELPGCTDPMLAVMRENSHRPTLLDTIDGNVLQENYQQKLAHSTNQEGIKFKKNCPPTGEQ